MCTPDEAHAYCAWVLPTQKEAAHPQRCRMWQVTLQEQPHETPDHLQGARSGEAGSEQAGTDLLQTHDGDVIFRVPNTTDAQVLPACKTQGSKRGCRDAQVLPAYEQLCLFEWLHQCTCHMLHLPVFSG